MASVSFDATGIIVPTVAEIRAEVVAKIKQIFATGDTDIEVNTDPSQPMGQVVDLIVAEIAAKNSEIAFLASQYSRKHATGSFLDALNSLYFLDRKTAASTIVQCTCTGLAGTLIPFGALVSDADGRRFRCLSESEIGSTGSALVDFSAVDVGALDVQPETVTRIITTVPGWDSVTNLTAGIQGRLRESDAEFRVRAAESVAYNSHGTVDAIRAAVAALDGVIDVEVLENATNAEVTTLGITIPAHSVAVCVEGGESADLAKAIYEKKSSGCGTSGNTTVTYQIPQGATYSYSILRPTATTLSVKVIFASAIPEAEQDAVRSAILADANGEGSLPRIGLAQRLYASRFWQAIAGASDTPLATVQVALGEGAFSDSVTIDADVEPVISESSIIIGNEVQL
jgi:uncharacterized phage protein gp47/JayE